MRNKTHLWKRSLAALLCFVMVLGMLPAFGMAPVAFAEEEESGETTDSTSTIDDSTGSENQGQQTNITGDYITLPITIRDFAADGMLFEFNELNETTFTRADDGTITWGTPTEYTKTDRLYTYTEAPYTAVYNPTYWDLDSTDGSQTWEDGELVADYTGIRIYPAGAELFETTDYTQVSGANWYCLIADADGNIVKVLDRTADKTNIADIMTEVGGAYSVWAWRGASNVPYYSVLAKVTEDNKNQYRFGFYDTTSSTLTAGDTGYFYLGQKYNTTADHQSFYVTTGNNITINSYDNWKRIVCDSDDQIVAVIPVGNTDDYSAYQTSDYTIVMYSKWNSTTEDTTSHITEDNMSEYQIVTPTCNVGGALFIERTINVNEANTKGFGLLYTLSSDYLHWIDTTNEAENLPNTTYYEYNYNYTTTPYEVGLWDQTPTGETPAAYATQDLYGAGIRTNLVTKELDPITGKPLYTQTTVAFLAKYMEQIMAVPEIGDNGAYNMHHVMGVKLYDESKQYVGPNSPLSVYDLADIFRLNVTDGLGDYDTSKAKFDSRALLYPHQATTWYDAAYYLLHMLWNDSPVDQRTGTEGQDGYGMPITNYNRIHLVKATNADGEACYVFNAKYDGTTYDFKNGEIFNSHFGENETTETREYSVAYTRAGAEDGAYGNPMPVNRFDPLGPSGAGVNRGYTMSGDTYGDFAVDSEQVRSEYYDETNYNLTLEGHAQFVYHEDSNQYFTFTGDDDVYLYINNIRVLDVGGAHSISKVSINLNDVAAEIGLKDGGTYRFDFFYTERHGTAANFGIETNIQIADASMNTHKTGYQGGVNTGYGGPVNKDTHVGYSFELQNDGTAHIYNLTFQDDQIGVRLSPDELQFYPETYPENYPEDKKELYDINDLYLIFWNSAGQMTEFVTPGSLDEAGLKQYLKDGLDPGEHIGIYGFKYFIPDSQWVTNYVLNEDGTIKTDSYGNKIVDNISFTNTVYTSANSSPDNKGTPLHGIADWKVVQMEVPYTAFHVYDWVHKNVSNDPEVNTDWQSTGVTVDWEKLDDYLQEEIDKGHITQAQLANAYIVRCTGSGNTDEHNQNSCVKVGEDKRSITYTSATTGKDTVFFLFKGISDELDDLVFSYEVYTYGVTDNVYVLDYGLSVELAGPTFGFQNNDVLTNNFNTNPVRITTTVVNPTSNYGTFTHSVDKDDDENTSISSLKYTPNKIINDIDTVQVKIKIVETMTKTETDENGETVETIVEKVQDIYTGVEMIQTITTAPASVVYYEEDFEGITYISAYKYKVDEAGCLLDEDDELIVFNEQNVKIVDGYLVYADGSKIQDANGNYVMVDKEGNLVDEDGKPIEDESITVQPVIVPDETGNVWIHYETVDEEGNSLAGTEQSANPDQPYGSDENYESDISGDIDNNGENWSEGEVTGVLDFELDTSNLSALQSSVGNSLNDYFGYENDLGYSGTDSNGTVNVLQVKETAEVLFFDFVGTGFEILSRTTDEQYAIINVIVYELDENGEIVQVQKTDTAGNPVYKDGEPVMINKIVAAKPVITESKGGDLYQVPIISIQGLDRDNYRVVVKAGTTGKVERVLYIDGIRIYGPLSDGAALEYYNPEEYLADTFEVKQMIQNGKVVYLSAGENLAGNIVFNPVLEEGVEGTGYTVIENVAEDAESVLIQAANPNEYLKLGPNNELYLDEYAVAGGETVTICNLIMCILTPQELDDNGHPYPEGARTVQIGAHRKINDTAVSDGAVYVVYGKDAEEMLDPENPNTIEIRTGTEMYYPIDVSKLEKVKLVKDGVVSEEYSYLLFLGIRESEYYDTTLALTNMKIAGYTVEPANTQFQKDIEDDNLEENVMYRSAARYFVARKALVEESNKTPEVEVNENLTITSASLKATKVYSGKAAIVTVKAGAEAKTIVVYDAQGNEVTATRCTSKVSGGTVTFTFNWNVVGTKGEALKFTIRVFDANGLASVNTEEVTVTIR